MGYNLLTKLIKCLSRDIINLGEKTINKMSFITEIYDKCYHECILTSNNILIFFKLIL